MDRTNSSNSIGAALKKVESYQYPATHMGHLRPQQDDSLQEFKKLAEQKGYYKPVTGASGATHDDETMLRYLRARKFSPPDAFVQFKDTEDWRRDNKIDNLYATIDVEEYDQTRRLYPQWTGRRDKRGIPVYTFEVAPLNSKRMSAYEKNITKSTTTAGGTSPKLLRLFALYENLLQFAMPLCSAVPDRPYAETPVSQSNNIVDIAGVGLKQFWNLRQHMQDASQLATAHYPETLDRIFVIGAPSFFPTVWSWVKGWFDPITVSKIFILSKQNMKSTLEMYIDPSNIPRKYGGTLDWEWGEMPTLEPAIANALEWERPAKNKNGQNVFPSGPIKWRRDESGDLVARAVGSENGKQRDFNVARIHVQKDLSLGPVSSRLAVENTLFGEPSTTGTHTHPSEGQEYFPPTGVTPPDEEHDEQSFDRALGSDHDQHGTSAGSDGAAAAAGAAGFARQNANIPVQASSSRDQYRSLDPSAPTRSGTSESRSDAQAPTHARGELANSTPDVIDHGYGDKTVTMESATVGQAHKNVEVPKARQDTTEDQQQPGYLDQARTAASGAAASLSAASTAAMAKVGLANGEEAAAPMSNGHTTAKEHELPVREAKEDPRIDHMQDKEVEEFIRSKYASSSARAGGKK